MNNRNQTVSVIIPCYNDGKYLIDAIESVKNQSMPVTEIIIVDDESTDIDTKNILDDLLKDKMVKVIFNKHGGVAKARNTGIEAAHSEFILTLDSDDRIDLNYIQKTLPILIKSANEYAFINTWWYLFGNKSGVVKKSQYDPFLIVWENCVGNNCLFRKSVWEEVYGYSTNLDGIEDWDYWIKIVAKGYKWLTIEEPLMHYRVRDNSLSKGNKFKIKEYSKILIENNHKYFEDNLVDIYIKGNDRWYQEFSKNNH